MSNSCWKTGRLGPLHGKALENTTFMIRRINVFRKLAWTLSGRSFNPGTWVLPASSFRFLGNEWTLANKLEVLVVAVEGRKSYSVGVGVHWKKLLGCVAAGLVILCVEEKRWRWLTKKRSDGIDCG
jgi:hypothetical protein